MVEIIPKPAPKLPWWQNFLLYFSIVLFLLSLSSYFILSHSLKKTSQVLQNLEETLVRGKTSSEIVLETEVFGYQKKIADFAQLVKGHKKTSKFFEFLEKISHPKVWFKKISLSPEDFQAVVSGESETFQTLGQQLLIFKEEPLIKNLNLSKIAIGKEGRVNFILNLTLDPKVFK